MPAIFGAIFLNESSTLNWITSASSGRAGGCGRRWRSLAFGMCAGSPTKKRKGMSRSGSQVERWAVRRSAWRLQLFIARNVRTLKPQCVTALARASGGCRQSDGFFGTLRQAGTRVHSMNPNAVHVAPRDRKGNTSGSHRRLCTMQARISPGRECGQSARPEARGLQRIGRIRTWIHTGVPRIRHGVTGFFIRPSATDFQPLTFHGIYREGNTP
jgi:hypothetical protein